MYILENKKVIDNIFKYYDNGKHENAIDLADNIIDYTNFSFVGGSRNILIDYEDIKEIIYYINQYSTFKKKVIFIFMLFFKNYFEIIVIYQLVFNTINKFTDNNIDLEYIDIINNICKELKRVSINLIIIIDHYCNNISEFYYNIFLSTDIKKKQQLYSQYIKLCTRYSNINISNYETPINIILIKFFSAFIHDPILYEKSFDQILKYYNFYL
jgi:hypothetical protein